MSNKKNKAIATDTAPPVDRSAQPSGFFQKLKSVFSKGPIEPAPAPRQKKAAPKKGSTSFMQSFKVREVGRDREESSASQPSGKNQPIWADDLQSPAPSEKSKGQEATGRLTRSVSTTSTILRPDDETDVENGNPKTAPAPPPTPTPTVARKTSPAAGAETGPITPKSYIIKPDTDKLKISNRELSETSKKKPTTGKLIPSSTILMPEVGEREKTPLESTGKIDPPTPPSPPSPLRQSIRSSAPGPKPSTSPIKPQSFIIKPDTGKIPPEVTKSKPVMPVGKQTHKISVPSELSSEKEKPSAPSVYPKPSTGPVKPQSILLSPETDRIKKEDIRKKSTLDLNKKQTSAIPAPAIEKAIKEGKGDTEKKSVKPPTGWVKPQSILLSPDTDEIKPKPPSESGKKTERNLKKETIRGLIPLPSQPAGKSPGLLTKPQPPQMVPTPPEKSRDTSVLTKGSLTGKIRIEGMSPPAPPPVVSKPTTRPMKPSLDMGKEAAKSLTGRIEPQSIIIRPDTDKLRATRKDLASESGQEAQKPKTGAIQPQSTLLQPEKEDRHERTPLVATGKQPAESKAPLQEAPKYEPQKPGTGRVRPESIVISPDTGEIKDVPREGASTTSLRTRIEIKGIQPPPPPVQELPQPKPIEPALKDIPRRKPDTGPVTPQSIVIRPDTASLQPKKPLDDGGRSRTETAAESKTAKAAPPIPPKAVAKPTPAVPGKFPAKKAAPVVAAKPLGKVKAKPEPEPKVQAKASAAPSAVAAAMSERAAERKSKPPVVRTEADPRRRRSMLWKGGLVALLLIFLGLGIYFLTGFQDTQLVVQIQKGDLVVDPQVHVVLNIAGKLEIIRQEYQRRIRPIEEEISELQQYLSSAKADLAGKTSKLNLLQEQLDKYQSDIPRFLAESRSKLDALWSGPATELDRAFEDKKQALLDTIAERAALLQIPYAKNSEVNEIPVAVNAYRLALYGQSNGINPSAERRWTETIVKEWEAYQEEWRQAQLDLKKEALKIKKEPVSKITSAEQQVDSLLRELSAVQMDLRMLSSEVTRYEELLADARLRREQAVPPFLDEIGRIPGDFEVAQFPLREDGSVVARNLQDSDQLKAGDYYVLVLARQGEEQSWAVKAVTIIPNEINNILIKSGDFRSFAQILEGETGILLSQSAPTEGQ